MFFILVFGVARYCNLSEKKGFSKLAFGRYELKMKWNVRCIILIYFQEILRYQKLKFLKHLRKHCRVGEESKVFGNTFERFVRFNGKF